MITIEVLQGSINEALGRKAAFYMRFVCRLYAFYSGNDKI
jgi:hypothetical protein